MMGRKQFFYPNLRIIKKEHNFDTFTIDFNYINGKFNSVIKR